LVDFPFSTNAWLQLQRVRNGKDPSEPMALALFEIARISHDLGLATERANRNNLWGRPRILNLG